MLGIQAGRKHTYLYEIKKLVSYLRLFLSFWSFHQATLPLGKRYMSTCKTPSTKPNPEPQRFTLLKHSEKDIV